MSYRKNNNEKMDLETQFSEKCQTNTNNDCSQHDKTLLIKFDDGTQVLRGKCTSHHGNGTYYIGTDMQSGDFYIVKEFVLPALTDQELTELLQEIQASADLKNANLAEIKNIKHEIRDDKCIFYILQEFDFNSIYLSQLLTTKIPLSIKVLKGIVQQIFILRKFLNSINFSYLDFTSSAIYIKENGDLKFINYGKTARLFSFDFENPTDVQLQVTNAQKCKLGLLLSSLFKGESFSNSNEVLPNNILPFKIQEFLNLCSQETLEDLSLGQLFDQSFDVSPTDECLASDHNKSGVINTLERSKSRVEDDFEKQDLLGEGAFGKVYKVLKKFDGQTYALKKILLKPNNENLNDKMIREVRILSQLNHENIVRYYNSWTESEEIDGTDSESSEYIDDENSSSTEDTSSFEMSDFAVDNFCDMSCGDEISERSGPKGIQNDFEEDESILFQTQTGTTNKIIDNLPIISIKREVLYIQMEFCENQTLRSVINSGTLLQNETLVLKYLRQIVEGLVYIHQQNIVHRDLKPMNIFLSSNDLIKIGDFGLATKRIHYKSQNNESGGKAQSENSASKNDNKSLTSQVGTGIYIAPELNTYAHICDQKLDMYSLGIILFEMCYKKPLTDQEWNNIIIKLRSKDVIFPKNFGMTKFYKEKRIIESLLTHDVLKRPTSKELLKRDDLPPIVKSEDEEKQQELFSFVVDNPHLNSRLFRYFMDCCFNKENKFFIPVSYRNLKNFEVVNKAIMEVFKTHGAQNISRSTLIPTKCCKGNCHGCIKLMNRLGGFHYIADNNNIPFINFVALNDRIKWFKCYSLDKKIKSPLNVTDENYEYNFNIITPIDFSKSSSFLPDAEILVTITQIKNLLFSSQSDVFKIWINHTLLIEAIYIECNIINSTNYDEIVSPFSVNSRRSIHAAYFSATCNTQIIDKLPSKLNSIDAAMSILKHFKVPEAQSKAKQALEELRCILRTAKKLGLKNHDVMIAPKLCKNLTLYSGMIFEYVNVTKQKVLGVGGRYDKLIKHFQDIEEIPRKHTFKYGIGMSLNIETWSELCQVKEEIIVVCTFNPKGIFSTEVEILKDLWNANFVCTYFKAKSMQHLKSHCRNNSASYAIVLSGREIKKNLIKIINFKEKERITEVPLDSLISTFQQYQNAEPSLSIGRAGPYLGPQART